MYKEDAVRAVYEDQLPCMLARRLSGRQVGSSCKWDKCSKLGGLDRSPNDVPSTLPSEDISRNEAMFALANAQSWSDNAVPQI